MNCKLERLIGWLRRIFKRPRYVMGWDKGEDRDYWAKSRIHADGTIEIIGHGGDNAPSLDTLDSLVLNRWRCVFCRHEFEDWFPTCPDCGRSLAPIENAEAETSARSEA